MTLPVIIDCGSGYTKMGIAGESGPSHVIQTLLYREDKDRLDRLSKAGVFPVRSSASPDPVVCTGQTALERGVRDPSGLSRPVIEGRVSNWTDIEFFLGSVYMDHLTLDPSERPVILTEPPTNPASNRERLAEIMFETFSVPGLHIGIQAVLALYAYWDGVSAVTGTVIDSGDGVTHVIPVTDGYVSGTSVREIPIAGKDVTELIAQSLARRGEVKDDSRETLNRFAKQIKEASAYVAMDPISEFGRYDADPGMITRATWKDPATRAARDVDIGYEKFLGPEIFFQPGLASTTDVPSLPVIVNESIQSCPIDYRRGLYSNIVLSGGSTMFRNFPKRLEREVETLMPGHIPVRVLGDDYIQRFAVWHGASRLAQSSHFDSCIFTREQYEEVGPFGARESSITRCLGL